MADERYRWLDLETAERLLRGESLEAVDEAARDQAERLAKTLDALTVEPAPTSDGLPGEEAALAAFRKVRAERADDWVSPPAQGRRPDRNRFRRRRSRAHRRPGRGARTSPPTASRAPRTGRRTGRRDGGRSGRRGRNRRPSAPRGRRTGTRGDGVGRRHPGPHARLAVGPGS